VRPCALELRSETGRVHYSYVLKQAVCIRAMFWIRPKTCVDCCGLSESVCHGEAVEPVVVKCNAATREQTMAQLIAYPHMDFSHVIKIKMDSRSVWTRQPSDCHASDKVTFCSDFPSVWKSQVACAKPRIKLRSPNFAHFFPKIRPSQHLKTAIF
jgi:hypothetical protein